LAVFIFPLAGHALSMSALRFGLWCGSAINDTSSVVAAAFSYSDAAGHTATVVKLTRTLMIIPIVFILTLRQAKKEGGQGGFKLSKIFPWFVVAFLLACIVNTMNVVPSQMGTFWGNMGKFFILTAMAAIGLNTNLRDLLSRGKKAVLLGACCSVAVTLVSLFTQFLLGVS